MPLPNPTLLVTLTLTVIFGVITLGLGINSLEKSNEEKDFVQEHAPSGARVNIDTSDVFQSGINITVIGGILALSSLITLLYLSFRPLPSPKVSDSTPTATRRTLVISSSLHAFFSVWILAALIPFLVFVRNRSAQVSAFLGEVRLPDALVAQQQAALGVTPIYWEHDYLRVNAILPWFTVLFGFASSVILYRAASVTANIQRTGSISSEPSKVSVTEAEKSPA